MRVNRYYFSEQLRSLKRFASPYSMVFIFQLIFYILLSLNREIWIDEAYSLTTSSHNFLDIFTISLDFEGNPPLYFLLLGAWRMLDFSVFFARLLSIALTVLASSFFYKILQSFMQRNHALLIIILLIFNPFIVFIATSVRYYALVFLLSNLIIFLFLRYFVFGTAKPKQIILFSIVSILSIGTQYQMVFLLFALGIALPCIQKWKVFYRYIAAMIGPVLFFIAMMGYLIQVISTLSGYSDIQFGFYNIYRTVVSWVEVYLGFFHWQWSYHSSFYWFFRLPLLVLFLNFVLGTPAEIFKKNDTYKVVIISVAIIISIFLMLLFYIIQEVFFTVWHGMVLLPLLLMLMALLFEYGRYKRINYIAFLALFLIQLVGIHNNYSLHFLSQGFQEVSQHLKNESMTDKTIFVFPAETALIAKYELPSSVIISVPVEIDFFDVFDHDLWVLDSNEQLENLFLPIIEHTDTINLIRKKNFIPFYNVDYHTHILDSFLRDQGWKVLTDTTFTKLEYFRFTQQEE